MKCLFVAGRTMKHNHVSCPERERAREKLDPGRSELEAGLK